MLRRSGRERPAEAPAGPAAIEFLARDLKGALLQQQAGDHLLELLIILLERSQGLGVRAGHHAQLLLPAAEGRGGDVELPADLGDRGRFVGPTVMLQLGRFE